MKSKVFASIGIAALFVSSAASAEPMPARETARVLPQKGYSIGINSPTAVGLGHGLEVTTMAVPWLLLSPNASLRAELWKSKTGMVFTAEYGLGVPTGAMRLTQGYLFPTWETSGKKPGFVLQQYAGFWLSGAIGERATWTARADVAAGLPLGDNPQTPMEAWVPFDLWFAPATAGSRWHLGGTYDRALLDWLRIRTGVNLYAVGRTNDPPRSPIYVSAEAALEAGIGKRFRIALGAVWYNYDQRETVVEKGDDGRWQRIGVRSNDFLPTLDLIWYSP